MCGNDWMRRVSNLQQEQRGRPAEGLAALLNIGLNISVQPHELEHFVRTYWTELRKLAHQIHEGR